MSNAPDSKREKAIKKMRELIERTNPCVFCTKLGHVPFASRPMTTVKVDDDGTLWFFSSADSLKNSEIKLDDHVELIYGELKRHEFLSIYGRAEILREPELAKEFWKPIVETWFEKGPEDPELTLIKVTPILGRYWDEKQNRMAEMFKMNLPEMAGSASGDYGGVGAMLSS